MKRTVHLSPATRRALAVLLGALVAARDAGAQDCNANGMDDALDIARGVSTDCDFSAVPDECELDCDADRLPDACELSPPFVFSSSPSWRTRLASESSALAVGDIDGDGVGDAVLAGPGDACPEPRRPGAITVLRSAAGRFELAGRYEAGAGVEFVSTVDLDRDGDLDVVACEPLSSCGADGSLAVFRNAGGTLAPPERVALPGGPRTAAAIDLEGDGDIDLAAGADDDGAPGVLLLVAGTGGFDVRRIGSTGGASFVVAADWDGDARDDLAAASLTRSIVAVLDIGPGGAVKRTTELQLPDVVPQRLSLGDTGGDGDHDLIAAGTYPGSAAGWIQAHANDGTGSFQLAASAGLRFSAASIFAGDMDGDALEDLAVAGAASIYEVSTGAVSVLAGLPGDSFRGRSYFSFPELTFDARAPVAAGGDVDRDGDLDLVLADQGWAQCGVLLNDGAGLFPHATNAAVEQESLALAATDIDGDGASDLVNLDRIAGKVHFLMQRDATFELSELLEQAAPDAQAIAPGDLDQDGDADLAVARGTRLQLRFNAGGTFPHSDDLPLPSSPIDVAAVDLSGDGRLDLVTANLLASEGSDNVTVLLAAPGGGFALGRNYVAGAGSMGLTTADVDVDGDVDVLVASLRSEDLVLLRNDGAGTLRAGERVFSRFVVESTAAGDADGDGAPDLVIFADGLRLLTNDGAGRFAPPGEPLAPFGRGAARLADLDRDGDADLAALVGYSNVGLFVFPGSGRGTFGPPQALDAGQGAPPPPASSGLGQGGSGSEPAAAELVTNDLDGDGDLDLALGLTARRWITVMWNDTPQPAADADADRLLDACDGDVAAPFRRGDVNQDRRRDIADAVSIIRHLFFAAEPLACRDAADANDDGALDVSDAVSLLGFLFLDGMPPPSPSAACGVDPTPGSLGCESFEACGT